MAFSGSADGSPALLPRIAFEALLFFVISYSFIRLSLGEGIPAGFHAGVDASVPGLSEFIIPALIFAVGSATVSTALGLYQPTGAFRYLGMLSRLVPAVLIGVPIAYLAFALIPHNNTEWLTPRVVLASIVLVAVRQFVVAVCDRGPFIRRILIVGQGCAAEAVGKSLLEAQGSSVKLVGYFPVESNEESAVPDDLVVRTSTSLRAVIAAEQVDEIIVAVRDQRGAALPLTELLDCRLQGVRITDLAQFYERTRGEVPVAFLKASYFIFGEGFYRSGGRELRKRVFDVLVSLILLALALPVMIIVALAIKLESRGPVIYRQQRVGFGGRPFDVLKFRSMRTDAEKDGQPIWASTRDPRVTRVGRFIRLTRIDELPQLFNVIRGEMSFVGPRPERPFFVEQLNQQVPFYGARHSVKPGITGWAQVRFPYGASVEDSVRKLEYDLYYIKNHSFLLDVIILLETVRVVIFTRGSR